MRKTIKNSIATTLTAVSLMLLSWQAHADLYKRMWQPHTMAIAQLKDVQLLAKYYTSWVTDEFEVQGTPIADIDAIDPSFTSAVIADLYVTDGVITIDLINASPLHSELRNITLTFTPNISGSLIQNWSCTASSPLNASVAGTAYSLASALEWPLSLC